MLLKWKKGFDESKVRREIVIIAMHHYVIAIGKIYSTSYKKSINWFIKIVKLLISIRPTGGLTTSQGKWLLTEYVRLAAKKRVKPYVCTTFLA